MKPTLITIASLIMAAACSLWTAAVRADSTFTVNVNTAPLIGHPAGPFSLDYQLIDGSGTLDGNNTATISNFNFGGGSGPSGAPNVIGGASGSLAGTVGLNDNSFFNDLNQQFGPGNTLSFAVDVTTNPDTPSPDGFSFSILDSQGFQIPTLDPSGGNALVFVQINGTQTIIQTFGTDQNQAPAAGGGPLNIGAPRIGAPGVPEPSTCALLVLGGLFLRRWVQRRPIV